MTSLFNNVTYRPLASSPSSSTSTDSNKNDTQIDEEILDDPSPLFPEQETGKATFFVYVLVFCVCLSGFLFGYDTGGKFWV
jgi:SP family myo-inositol transporter-like MFS transporter 13